MACCGIDDADIRLRNTTYALFVELGRAPRSDEVADIEQSTRAEVESGWRRLHEAHALVLHAGGDIRMANPFSAVPTAYRVLAGERWWFANCAWDAFGVCAALQSDGDIESSCPDCGEAIRVEVRDQQPSDPSLLFHCLVPAVDWWNDIGFT
ncbi:MAG TPA: organomercurial lyase [Acidimicrobiales bacterium]|nr:organomercurial lyase [Acidimicrobiales bacterium]